MDIELTLSAVVFVLLMTTAILLYRGSAKALSEKDREVSRRLGLNTSRTLTQAKILIEGDDNPGPTNDNYLIPQFLYSLIDQAGIEPSAPMFAGIIGVLFVTGTVMSLSVLSLEGAIAVGLAIGVSPLFYLRFKRRARLRKFGDQLPYLLDLLRSGDRYSFAVYSACRVWTSQTGVRRPLFRDPTGVRLLEVAVALDLMAFLAMTRIGRVDY